MKGINKIKTITCLLIVAILSICMSASMMLINNAKANGQPTSEQEISLYVAGAGAQMTDGQFTIRFQSVIDKSSYDTLDKNDANVKLGMIIGPKAMLKDVSSWADIQSKELTPVNGDGIGDYYNFCNYGNGKIKEANIYKIDFLGQDEFRYEAEIIYNEAELITYITNKAQTEQDADKKAKYEAMLANEGAGVLLHYAKIELTAIPYYQINTDDITLVASDAKTRSIRNSINDFFATSNNPSDIWKTAAQKFVGPVSQVDGQFYIEKETNKVYVENADKDLVPYDLTAFSLSEDIVVDTKPIKMETDSETSEVTLSDTSFLKAGEDYILSSFGEGSVNNIKAKAVTKVISTADELQEFHNYNLPANPTDESTPSTTGTNSDGSSYTNTVAKNRIVSLGEKKDGYYVLANDIENPSMDLAIFPNSRSTRANAIVGDGGLTGTFDGRGKTISDISGNLRGGMFIMINGGTVKNVAFKDAKIGFINNIAAATFFAYKTIGGTFENIYINIIDKDSNSPYFGYDITGTSFRNVIVEGSDDYLAGSTTTYASWFFGASNGAWDGNSFTDVYNVGDSNASTGSRTIKIMRNENENSISDIKEYADYNAMANAANDYDSFDSNLWDLNSGYPVWKTDVKNPVFEVISNNSDPSDLSFDESITLTVKYDGENVTAKTTFKAINSDNVSISGSTISRKTGYSNLFDEAIYVNYEYKENSTDLIGLSGTAKLTLNAKTEKLNDYEVYVQEDGTMFNLESDDLDKLANATFYDNNKQEITLANNKFTGISKEGKTLGETYKILANANGSAYSIEYMYVTKVLTQASDFASTFIAPYNLKYTAGETQTVNAGKNADGTDYENILTSATKITKLEQKIDGYYVLGNDINWGTTKRIEAYYNTSVATNGSARISGDGGFVGTFDGRGHIVTGVQTYCGGIFLRANNATVKNVAFDDAMITWTHTNGRDFGLIAMQADSLTMENVYINILDNNTHGQGMVACPITSTSMTFKNVILEGDNDNSTITGWFVNDCSTNFTNVYKLGTTYLIRNNANGTMKNVTELANAAAMTASYADDAAAKAAFKDFVDSGYWTVTKAGGVVWKGLAN